MGVLTDCPLVALPTYVFSRPAGEAQIGQGDSRFMHPEYLRRLPPYIVIHSKPTSRTAVDRLTARNDQDPRHLHVMANACQGLPFGTILVLMVMSIVCMNSN